MTYLFRPSKGQASMTRADDRRPTPTDLRWFGVVFAAVFLVVGTIVGWRFEATALRTGLFAVGLGGALVYYALPPLRVPLYLSWMAIFAPIGLLISTLLLGFIYFVVLTPIAMLMRLVGRDRLGTRFDASRGTYWVTQEPTRDVDRYFRQT